MNIELVVVIAIVLFILGWTMFDYRKAIRVAVALMMIGSLIFLWAGIAVLLPKRCTDVSYHPIIQQKMPNGATADIAEIIDDNGDKKVINLNSLLGIRVPLDTDVEYQLVKIEYDRDILGLRIPFIRPRYKLVPISK